MIIPRDANHDGPAMNTRDDLVFDALTRELAASAALMRCVASSRASG